MTGMNEEQRFFNYLILAFCALTWVMVGLLVWWH